jgi:hypothetical protein
VEASLQAAMTSIDGVEGALTGVGFSGTNRTATLKLYVPDATPTSVDDIVDRALGDAWSIMPSQPVTISVEVVAATKPDDAALTDRDGIDLGDLGTRLGFEQVSDGRLLVVTTPDLEGRYGPWVAP